LLACPTEALHGGVDISSRDGITVLLSLRRSC